MFKNIASMYRKWCDKKAIQNSPTKYDKVFMEYLFNDTKTFFRLTKEESTYLENQIMNLSDEDFSNFNFSVGEFKDGELEYLLSCLHNKKSMKEADDAYDFLCTYDTFKKRSEKLV